MFDHIRNSTASTDLQMIAIDEAVHSADASAFLKRRGYKWRDFAFSREIAKALDISAIPLIVLINSEGNIVYYHSGADDDKGLARAIAKLGPAYEGVRLD